MQLDIAGD